MTKSLKTSSKSRFHVETYKEWDIAAHKQCMGPPWVAIARKQMAPSKIRMFNVEGATAELVLAGAKAEIDKGFS